MKFNGQDASLHLNLMILLKGMKKECKITNPQPQSTQVWVTHSRTIFWHSRRLFLCLIDYTDISQREQLAAAIKRWPLLAEFAQQQ